jgi:hypothetical protein
MMMRVDSKYHARNILGKFYNMLKEEWDDFPAIIELKPMGEDRSLSQNALCHKWYRIIAQNLNARGVRYTEYYDYEAEDANPDYTPETRDYDEELVKEVLKFEVLGTIKIKRSNGKIIEVSKSTSNLSKGETQFYMNRVYEKAYNLGIILPIPEDSQYQKLEDKQNA